MTAWVFIQELEQEKAYWQKNWQTEKISYSKYVAKCNKNVCFDILI